MRFRISGNNQEGRPWVLAAGLMVFARQIDDADPTRHTADGTVASKAHDANNPSSRPPAQALLRGGGGPCSRRR